MTAASLTVLSLSMRYTCASAVLTTVTPRYTSSGAAGVLLLQILLHPVLMTSTTLLCTYSAAAVPCCGDRLNFTYTCCCPSLRRTCGGRSGCCAAISVARLAVLGRIVAATTATLAVLLSMPVQWLERLLCLCWRLRLHVQIRLLYYC